MGTRRGLSLLGGLALAGLVLAAQPAGAQLREIHATQSGEPAYDHDAFGGNPFASALIAALEPGEADPVERLVADTISNSGGMQFPDLSRRGEGAVLVPAAGERAVALVAVFADYGDASGLASLPGAAFDAIRVGRALAAAGYAVRTVIAEDASAYRAALDRLRRDSADADRTLLYTTGHGVEHAGAIHLLPPEVDGLDDPLSHAITLAEVAAMLDGPGERLLLYAGCRDNPDGLSIEASRPHD